jgi:hypothetical protein
MDWRSDQTIIKKWFFVGLWTESRKCLKTSSRDRGADGPRAICYTATASLLTSSARPFGDRTVYCGSRPKDIKEEARVQVGCWASGM